MDVITAVLKAPVNTIMIIAGLVILFFALFEVGKGSVQLRSGNSNIAPIVVGAVLVFGGLLYKSGNSAPETPSVEFSVASATPSPAAASETFSPTDTPAPSATPADTYTPEPSPTPEIKTLTDGCIASQVWQANSIDTGTLGSISSQDSCLNLNALGISVETGGKLCLLATASKADLASGISVPVGDQSVIEFKVFVKNFYIVYPGAPAYITFSIAPTEDPMATRGSGRFKLHIEDVGDQPWVYFVLADSTEATGSKVQTQHYLYGNTYTVRLELKGLSMETYINDVKLNEDVAIPTGAKAFYIGYNLPVLASADIEITDIKVDGNTP